MRAKTLENKGQSQQAHSPVRARARTHAHAHAHCLQELPHGKAGGGGHFGVQPGFEGVVTESDLLHQLNNAVSEVLPLQRSTSRCNAL